MTIDEYNRKLAEMQTQMKELVPAPFVERYLDDALEKFGKKWYSHGYEDAMKKAIPIEWIHDWMEKQNSWNLDGVVSLLRDWEDEGKCPTCKHQIEPLRACEWLENGGDGVVHLVCPRWERKE